VPAIAAVTGLSVDTANRMLYGVPLPEGYPTDPGQWQQQVEHYYRMAIWKGSRRLADKGMEQLPVAALSVAMGISVDKLQQLANQPSVHLSITANLSQGDVLDRLAKIRSGSYRQALPSEPVRQALPALQEAGTADSIATPASSATVQDLPSAEQGMGGGGAGGMPGADS